MTQTPTPNIPPIVESDEREFLDSGVPSTVAIAKHPLHPLIVTFPIAFLTGALVTDLAYWLTGDLFWARGSFWLILAGVATSLVAAATGLADFLRIERVRQHSAGWIHLIGNIAAIVLSLINLVLRWNNQAGAIVPVGLLISLVVGTILGVTGWFGAELIYRHKVAVIGNGPNSRP
ncbi:hypothetical protein C7H19_08525 [Aphanothece hegewaldii CCALA 016]|uniref:DUF2231 domain-containing protein n=1 Tax=Aphanothece hegewaldii CCALA 016 TaxID=2107694 RepID=A0A2T1LYX5_9CHRO|nr:DUF2231 domain-containing protein [Aphanothece hegewaldii]PSF37593.1 hypothetical protein C7H19_08525 [Aphanothece hegewaldii CCALA 016]